MTRSGVIGVIGAAVLVAACSSSDDGAAAGGGAGGAASGAGGTSSAKGGAAGASAGKGGTGGKGGTSAKGGAAGSGGTGIGGAGGTGTSGSGTGGTGTSGSGTGGTGTSGSGTGGTGTSGTGGGSAGGASACVATPLLSSLGKSKVMIGASMADATAAAAPFDQRYQYLSGGIFDGDTPCASCAMGCTTGGTSCANSGPGCSWWGCWQYDQDPPGAFVRSFVTASKKNGQIPWITYYQELQASGASEGMGQVDAAKSAAFMKRYFADFRFLLQTIGQEVAFVHHEPDFWGYLQQAGGAHTITIANPTDCGAMENSSAGFGKCIIHMVRTYAPNAKIGLHASGWSSNMDVLGNKSASLDVAAEAKKTVAFLTECGAAQADFVVSDMSDRDAGYYQSIGKNTAWDATNATLPNFHQAFAWGKAISAGLSLPMFWWQTPVGNAQGNDTPKHWKDNRVDYLMGHLDEVAASQAAGVLFGAGDGNQTTPETDGGNLIAKVKAYAAGGGTPACP
jgi:hypothetical protein